MEMDSKFSSCKSTLQYGSSGPRNLPLEYLRNITNNFSDELLLGGGGFGTVYKGVLPNGETIAVKKLRSNSSMPEVTDKQFENEVCHLMRLKHQNIVLLVGWCYETENIYVEYNGKYIWAEKSERLLCLEYMPCGNLCDYLSDESSGLTWETRYKIIEGICHGLHYLHGEWHPNAPIIHMDLKPANILLDNNMVPKIADFGLSRLFSEGKTRTCTISRDGTLGYMAPEYINRGFISTKSDIFSLGVIILEIVSGQRDYPDESETEVSSKEFTELILENWRDRLQKSPRCTTSLETDYQQIRRCIQIGLDCVKLDRRKRPTISQVIEMLHGAKIADFSYRKDDMSLTNEVCQQQCWVSTSKAPLEKKECQYNGSHAGWTETDRAPRSRPAPSFGHPDAMDNDKEDNAMLENPSLGESSDYWTANSSLSSMDCDETSSWTADIMGVRASQLFRGGPPQSIFYYSPNGRFRRRIRSWTRGVLLGSGSFGMVYEGITVFSLVILSWIFRFKNNIPKFVALDEAIQHLFLLFLPCAIWMVASLFILLYCFPVTSRKYLTFCFCVIYVLSEGVLFAVKEVKLSDQGSNMKQCIFQLEQEIELLSQFEHENIVQYYGTDKEDSKLYVFLELVTQGSLASLYQKYRVRETHVSAYTRQILNGLTYLHERNIVHRDIKCANIMVHVNGSVKLADFGLAKEVTKWNAIKSFKGTVYWMAPEVVNPKKTYGPAADIWSLGCTVLEMLTRQNPYHDLEWTQALYKIAKGEAPSIPSAFSKNARDFISQCIKPNPEDRPSASELLEHPFLAVRSIKKKKNLTCWG